ncbi:MAG: YncE family protein [bacterium]
MIDVRRAGRQARWLLASTLLATTLACTSEDPALAPPPPPTGDTAQARVLVVNTLSETLSSLDLGSGRMSVNAAVVGTWANRVAAMPGGQLLLVTDSGSNEVEVLAASTLAHLRSIDVGAGRNPWTTKPLDAARALVTNWLGSEARVLQVPSGSLGRAIPTTVGPEGFASAGQRAYVACSNFGGTPGSFGEGRLDVIDASAQEVIASVAVGRNPQDVAIAADGRVHVLCTGDYAGIEPGRVDVVDPSSLAVVGTVPLGGSPERVAAGPDGAMWTVGFQGGLRRYDPSTLAVLGDPVDPQLTGPLSAIAVDGTSNTVYVTAFDDDRLLAVDGTTRLVTNTWQVGDGPVDVIVLR